MHFTSLLQLSVQRATDTNLLAVATFYLCVSPPPPPPPPQETSATETQFINPLDDLSPFFQRQYIKGHSSDIFMAYGQLLAELLLVLPCQVSLGEIGTWCSHLDHSQHPLIKCATLLRRLIYSILDQFCQVYNMVMDPQHPPPPPKPSRV